VRLTYAWRDAKSASALRPYTPTVMSISAPPAYAWDWFARQRLLWREVRQRLARIPGPTQDRYRLVSAKADVIARLRTDYPVDTTVRNTVHQVITEIAFLGRTDRRFEDLGLRNAPRGLRWWWSVLTGEELTAPVTAPATALARQLEFPDVLGGYGDPS